MPEPASSSSTRPTFSRRRPGNRWTSTTACSGRATAAPCCVSIPTAAALGLYARGSIARLSAGACATPARSLDYAPQRENWFVLSGTIGQEMFYERVSFSWGPPLLFLLAADLSDCGNGSSTTPSSRTCTAPYRFGSDCRLALQQPVSQPPGQGLAKEMPIVHHRILTLPLISHPPLQNFLGRLTAAITPLPHSLYTLWGELPCVPLCRAPCWPGRVPLGSAGHIVCGPRPSSPPSPLCAPVELQQIRHGLRLFRAPRAIPPAEAGPAGSRPSEPNCTTEASRPGWTNLSGLGASIARRWSRRGRSRQSRHPRQRCDQRHADLDHGQPCWPRPIPTSALSLRIRLEYERDCFRRAELRARERLLQSATRRQPLPPKPSSAPSPRLRTTGQGIIRYRSSRVIDRAAPSKQPGHHRLRAETYLA